MGSGGWALMLIGRLLDWSAYLFLIQQYKQPYYNENHNIDPPKP